MSRSLATALINEVKAPSLSPVLLYEGLFESGAVRFWNGLGNLTAFGNTYSGSGNLLSISEYQETQDLQARGITFTLTGIPSNLLSIALQEPYQGKEASIYFGALDDTGVLVSDPYKVFSGFMDVMKIVDGGEYGQIQVTAENKAVILTRKKDRRYTPEDQKSDYVGDLGFDYVPLNQDREIIWRSK